MFADLVIVASKAELPDLNAAKRVKAHYLVTLALQSYKAQVSGATCLAGESRGKIIKRGINILI
ncbi:hypothetical protein CUN63_26500 [Pseudomonas sp. ACM7]|nr:hypothetical protein CUN63_26500 [Pseudomonas sp. ACM7]